MERADCLYVEICCLLKNCLHLRTVLSDDAEIVASCLACPVVILFAGLTDLVESSESSESISREQHLVLRVICHDDFRPVHHRSCYEAE